MGTATRRSVRRAVAAAGLFVLAHGAFAEEPAPFVGGIVTDEEGRGLSGVEVRVFPRGSEDDAPFSVRTEANGFFSAPTPRQGCDLAVDDDDYLPFAVHAVAPGTADVVIALARDRSLRGRVLDAAGNPIGGVSVELRPAAAPEGEAERREPSPLAGVRTEETGRFSIMSPGEGRWRVRFVKAGFLAIEQTTDYDPETFVARKVTLAAAASLAGRVLDADGKPVEGARVMPLFLEEGLESLAESARDHADETRVLVRHIHTAAAKDGAFHLDGLPADQPVGLVVWHRAFAPAILYDAATGAQKDSVMKKGAVLRGKISASDGGNIAEGRVEATLPLKEGWTLFGEAPVAANADAKGRFTLTRLPPGEIGVTARALRCVPTSVRLSCEDGGRLEHDFLLDAEPSERPEGAEERDTPEEDSSREESSESEGDCRLEIHASGPSGRPVSWLSVHYAAMEDKHGGYRARESSTLDGLAPGRYRVAVSANGLAYVAREVELKEGEEGERCFSAEVFALRREASLEIQVSLADGRPATDAKVALFTAGGGEVPPELTTRERTPWRGGMTDAEGRHRRERLPAGTYRILVEKDGWKAEADVSLKEGERKSSAFRLR